MNYLKIAATESVHEYLPRNWEVTTISEDTVAQELAAVVLKTDENSDVANRLVSDSGFNIPIIIVEPNDTIHDTQVRIENKIKEYESKNIPSFLIDLIKFADDRPVSFTTPGHHNGQFYEQHPAGVVFDRFFGKNMLYADTSDTVEELGDTMTHEGTPLTAEQKAAEAYNADKVYFCTNGTTSSNSICASALLTSDDLVLFDRNNHKSLYNSALVMSGAKPVYIPADRNPLGLIGEMDPKFFDEANIRKEISKVDPVKAKEKRPFRLAILQLETYDGIFYNAKWILDKIGGLCDYILFDCAWGGYEQFVPLLKDLSPLSYSYGPNDPGILVTQSIHKQQAGLGQTSQILKKDSHIKGQKRYVDHKHFNNAYLKYVTSSYSYPVYASLTVNAYMAASPVINDLWQNTLINGIKWRKELLKKSKLFKPLVPKEINGVSWKNIPTNDLSTDNKYWKLTADDMWHGFKKIVNNEVVLDPLKITIVTPGIDSESGIYDDKGIPGQVVAAFLTEKRIIRAKDDLNSLLFLLTPGDKKSDLDELMNALLEFEDLYFKDAPLKEVLPKLYSQYSDRYKDYSIQQLCNEIHKYYGDNKTYKLQQALFEKPDMQNYKITPQHADKLFMKNESELENLNNIVGKVALEGALPYPPGVFIVAPGEKWQEIDVKYFNVLIGAMNRFPGFVPEIQGVYINKDENGNYYAQAEVLSN
ncbi:putative ornithine decarboxylase [Companilactobacillus allii]|uniref:Ornithine decarboxylase n=1 Tax=Companilactobacillus allii TaxID=1847728 RepID=A0A1P8Q635_9LACO|nr:putative ornithine decarboxylase [Companilactobacillus allii]APX73283.1 ornithine decarboxylase [Companilactobacillus allii]USQ68097.1 putative ornithine decarboxylase [Companilactobacillus allii]